MRAGRGEEGGRKGNEGKGGKGEKERRGDREIMKSVNLPPPAGAAPHSHHSSLKLLSSEAFFQPKMQQISFSSRALSRPTGGAYSTPQTSYLD